MNTQIAIISLREALAIRPGEVVSLVGAGGKTSLMFALARELAFSDGKCVITTTTTKIYQPTPEQTPLLLIEADEERLTWAIQDSLGKFNHITVAAELLPDKKLRGVSRALIEKLSIIKDIAYIINEADGAKGLSLKAPNQTEPVIPSNTSLTVPVVGLDIIGCPLNENFVFRPEIVAELTDLPLDSIVTADTIARLITHSRGVAKGTPLEARIWPFLNKADIPHGTEIGIEVARRILASGHTQIQRVVVGEAKIGRVVAVIANS